MSKRLGKSTGRKASGKSASVRGHKVPVASERTRPHSINEDSSVFVVAAREISDAVRELRKRGGIVDVFGKSPRGRSR